MRLAVGARLLFPSLHMALKRTLHVNPHGSLHAWTPKAELDFEFLEFSGTDHAVRSDGVERASRQIRAES